MKIDIIRAWKDRAYRRSVSEEEQYTLPENTVGEVELTDAELGAVYGSDGGHHHHHRRHHRRHHHHRHHH